MISWLLSLFLVAFGQPAWSPILAVFAATFGYALFFYSGRHIHSPKKRFLSAALWYGIIQFIDLSWTLSHPFFYIYFVVTFASLLFGVQWGLFALFLQRKYLERLVFLFGLAGLWTLLEWSRLFIFSGIPFNPAGLALTGYLWPLQFAALMGVYGLTFWVIFTNLLCLRLLEKERKKLDLLLFLAVALFPYLFGALHLSSHSKMAAEKESFLKVLLVQPADPVEENQSFQTAEEYRQHTIKKWESILLLLKEHDGKRVELIVLPEYIVPYGTFHFVYPREEIQTLFKKIFGEVSAAFPSEETPYNDFIQTNKGKQWLVSNAYLAQTIANVFRSDLIVGLEDSVYVDRSHKEAETYSAAFYFQPFSKSEPQRYEKRILVPMGEYIPFQWCRDLGALYGIRGSFTPGKEAKIFQGSLPFAPSICYEEIFGDLTRESRVKGGELLVNLTNDGWFPNSMLTLQHFDHARLRTVENGIPLVRSTNTGLTAGIDSLGRIVGILGGEDPVKQGEAGSLYLNLPLYTYKTWYTLWGDLFILIFSLFFLLLSIFCSIIHAFSGNSLRFKKALAQNRSS